MLVQLNSKIKDEITGLNMLTHSYAELRSMNVEELNEKVAEYSVWKIKFEAFVGQLKSEATSAKLTYEAGLATTGYALVKEYEKQGLKPPAEKVREGEALSTNRGLKEVYQTYIEAQARYESMVGKLNSITTAYFSVQDYRTLKTSR